MSFTKDCWECGRSLSIEDQVCSKCGFDFSSHPQVMPKCPYCEKQLHLSDFFTTRLNKKGRMRVVGFIGEKMGSYMKMWYCPLCGKILGFSDAEYGKFGT